MNVCFAKALANASSSDRLKRSAIQGVALLLGADEDSGAVVVESDVIAIQSETFQKILPGGEYFGKPIYDALEVTESLAVLCVADTNKHSLIAGGVIPMIFEVLRCPAYHDDVHVQASLAIWRLSFSDEGKSVINSDATFIATLEDLAKKFGPIKKNCEGALFLLGHRKPAAPAVEASSGEAAQIPHVMLSYQVIF